MSNRKLILTVEAFAGDHCKVYRDSEWNEYRVVFYRDSIKQEGADYHTDDKADAISTAATHCIKLIEYELKSIAEVSGEIHGQRAIELRNTLIQLQNLRENGAVGH